MYKNYPIEVLQKKTQQAIAEAETYGVQVYVQSNPDFYGADIYVDPNDAAGIAIFREFAHKMVEHYKSLAI